MNIHYKQVIDTVLRSFSQIMLQNNTATGLFFCIGIGLNSPTMLLGAITAILASLATAKLCRYNTETVQQGIYSFNAALVGIAVFFFLPVSAFSLILLIFGAFLVTTTLNFMQIKTPNIPIFTAPFVLSTWLLLLIIEGLKVTNVIKVAPDLTNKVVTGFEQGTIQVFYQLLSEVSLLLLRGIGQVMQQDYWLSGFIFISALFVSNYKAAAWSVIGSAAGIMIARMFSYSESAILMGNYSFNSALTAIALAKLYGNKPLPILLGLLFTTVFTHTFEQAMLPALTAPFVLGCWLTMATKSVSAKIVKITSDDQPLN